jgi:hypothetical protein
MQHIASSAASAGMEVSHVEVLGRPTVVARTSQFRMKWFATRLHTFLFGAGFNRTSAQELDAFMDEASRYATDNKGGLPRGLQTGTAAIVTAITELGDSTLDEWALKPHGRRFAAMTFPVLADVTRRTVVRPQRMFIGAVYTSYLQQVVDDHVTSALDS